MTKNKNGCDLGTCLMCRCCIKDWIPSIGVNKKNYEIKRGQHIFREDDPVTGIYFVYSGKVKVHKRWDDDKDLILRFAKGGDILGHLGLGDNPVYPVTATAIEQAVVCYIDLPFFESTVNVNPKFTYELLKFFANELQESEKRVRNLVHMPVKKRIALALLNLKKQFGVNAAGAIDIELTRQDLSSFAAVSYETLFKVTQDFFQLKLIEAAGKSFRLLKENVLIEMAVENKKAYISNQT